MLAFWSSCIGTGEFPGVGRHEGPSKNKQWNWIYGQWNLKYMYVLSGQCKMKVAFLVIDPYFQSRLFICLCVCSGYSFWTPSHRNFIFGTKVYFYIDLSRQSLSIKAIGSFECGYRSLTRSRPQIKVISRPRPKLCNCSDFMYSHAGGLHLTKMRSCVVSLPPPPFRILAPCTADLLYLCWWNHGWPLCRCPAPSVEYCPHPAPARTYCTPIYLHTKYTELVRCYV